VRGRSPGNLYLRTRNHRDLDCPSVLLKSQRIQASGWAILWKWELYGASDLKPTRRKAALGGDDDECLLVDHRARTLENLISRPLNKMRSVRLRCELPPVTQSRDVLGNRDHGVRKFGVGWTTRCSGSPPLRALRSLYPTCWFEIACTI
jgi:hypothetical protein